MPELTESLVYLDQLERQVDPDHKVQLVRVELQVPQEILVIQDPQDPTGSLEIPDRKD